MKPEELKKKNDEIKNRNWKMLSPSQKHYTLMYFYRLATDPDDINLYIETYNFLKMAIDPYKNLPAFVTDSTPIQLLEEAYSVLNQPVPPYLIKEAKKYPLKKSDILPFTKMADEDLEVIKLFFKFTADGVPEKRIAGLTDLAKRLMRKYPNHKVQIDYEKKKLLSGHEPKEIA